MATTYGADAGAGTDLARRRYTRTAMAFHWLIAVLVIVNWRLVENAEHATGAARGALMNNHKALGITILLLSLARLAWKLRHPGPPFPAHYKAWEKGLARTVHFTFYVLLIGLPLGGWLANSLVGRSIDAFGLFTIPNLPVGLDQMLGKQIFDLHATGGTALLLLIALHITGALKHTLFDRDGELFRMLPFGRVGKKGG